MDTIIRPGDITDAQIDAVLNRTGSDLMQRLLAGYAGAAEVYASLASQHLPADDFSDWFGEPSPERAAWFHDSEARADLRGRIEDRLAARGLLAEWEPDETRWVDGVAQPPIRHLTEAEYRQQGNALATAVVTLPSRVGDYTVGGRRWSMRAVVVFAMVDGADVYSEVLEGDPDAATIRTARNRAADAIRQGARP